MKKGCFKRLAAIVLAMVLVFTMMPVETLAASSVGKVEVTIKKSATKKTVTLQKGVTLSISVKDGSKTLAASKAKFSTSKRA